MNKEDRELLVRRKIVAFFMMLVAFPILLIYGLPQHDVNFLPRVISGFFLFIGLSGAFIYIEQIKSEIIDVLQKRDSSD